MKPLVDLARMSDDDRKTLMCAIWRELDTAMIGRGARDPLKTH